MLIVAVLFLIITILTFVILRVLGSKPSFKELKKIRFVVCGVTLVLTILFGFLSAFKPVDSTEVGVVRTFGEINRQINSGPNFINPFVDKVTTYDLRVHIHQAQFASYTQDAQPMTASIEFQYALNPSEVMDVAREYGNYEALETKLDNVVQEKAKIVFAKYSAMTLLENRSTLSAEVTEEVKTLEELYHVNFTSVIVQDIDFSDAFEASVEAKMTAEQDALRAEQEKKTAVIKAEQEAETAAIEAQAAIAQAQGEAEAMRITREALQNMPDAYIQQLWIEKWNGQLPSVQAGESASVIVNPGMKDAG